MISATYVYSLKLESMLSIWSHKCRTNALREKRILIMTVDTILFLILTGVYIVFGGLGNAAILTVYARRKDSYNQHFFIKTLAALDLFICVVVIPYTIVYELHRVHNDVICRLMETIRHIAILTGNSVLCAIAFERYIAICHPMRKLNQHAVRKIMIFLTIVTCVFSSPSPTIFTVTGNGVDPYEVHVGTYCQFTTEILGILGTSIYQGALALLCLSGILSILVLYALIYRRLFQRVLLRRRNMSRPITPNKYVVRKVKEGKDSRDEPMDEQCSNENEVVLCLVENEAVLEQKRSPQQKVLFEKKSTNSRNEYEDIEFESRSKENPCETCIYVNKDNKLRNSDYHSKPNGHKNHYPKNKRNKSRSRMKPNIRRKTSIMLFVCSIIYILTWTPFWLDVFNVTQSLVLRYMFFIGHACNPVVYGIINNQVRSDVIKLFKRR